MGQPLRATSAVVDHPDFRAAFAYADKPESYYFSVPGVHCAKCVGRIEGGLKGLPQVLEARVDLGAKLLSLTLAASDASLIPATTKLAELGFDFHPVRAQDLPEASRQQRRRELLALGVAGACAGNIMLLAIAQYAGADQSEFDFLFGLTALGLFLPVLFFSAQSFYKSAWQGLKSRRVSIDWVVVTALIVGTSFSVFNLARGRGEVYFDSLAALIFLLLASRRVLAGLQEKHRQGIGQLGFLTHVAVEKLGASGHWEFSPVVALKVGDVIRLSRGDHLPVDGELVSTQARVSLAVLTGESHPVQVHQGQSVYAGSVVESDFLEVRIEKLPQESRLGQILRRFENATEARTPLLTFTDQVGQWFTVLVVAVGAGLIIGFWSTNPVVGIERALALTLLACPCALAIATPLAHALSLVRLAHRGIIVKRAAVLERVSDLRHVMLDKTGTLTHGNLAVLDIAPKTWSFRQQAIIHALERRSNHPIARALTLATASAASSDAELAMSDLQEIPGIGVRAKCTEGSVELRSAPAQSGDFGTVGTRVGYYVNGELQLTLTLGDELRQDAPMTVAELKKLNMDPWLVTGDALAPAAHIARLVGISTAQIRFGQSPEQKSAWVKEHSPALVVGDGVNDALAMAAADVSVAMSGGLEASLKSADIYLASGRISDLLTIQMVARETRRLIKRNLGISLVYNLTGASLAVLGYIHPLLAAILMPLSSISLMGSVLWSTSTLRDLPLSQRAGDGVPT